MIRERHHDNALRHLEQRLSTTADPVAQLDAVFDYARGAAGRARRRDPDRDLTGDLAPVMRALRAAGDRLLT
jgi:hypothetical protein